MWLYRFIDPSTRTTVPSLGSFLKWNHDITKVCYEQTYLPQEERLPFLQRFLKFVFYLGVLMSFIYVLGGFGNDVYYSEMCLRRGKCMQNCVIDYYPGMTCQVREDLSYEYQGNLYKKLYVYPKPENDSASANVGYNECLEFASHFSNVEKVPGQDRQARVHSCFPYCPNSNIVSADCIKQSLLCVPSSDECEAAVPFGDAILSEASSRRDSITFSPLLGIIALLITAPIQLLFEIYCVIISKAKISDKDGFLTTLKTVVMQVIAAGAVCTIVVYDAYCLINIHSVGQPWALWITYLFAFGLDQVKSVFVLSGIWYFLLRRCGYLQPTEQEYQEVSIASKLSLTILTQLRNLCMQNIETPWFNMLSRYMLGIYAGFVLFWLSAADLIDLESVCVIIDIVFLSIFTVELGVRVFGLGITYLFDCVNFADAVIIVVSLAMYLAGIVSKAMAVMRLIRVLLIVVVKFTGNQFQITLRRKEEDPVAALEALLHDLLKETAIKKSVKDEIVWALDVIEQNRLEEMELGGTKMDMYESTWLKVATGEDMNSKKWFDKDLEDALNEIHRESEEQAKIRIEGSVDHVRRFLDLANKEWIVANKLSDDLRTAMFDENVFAEFMKDRALIYLGFKLFTYYDLFDKFGIGPDQMAAFLKQATASYYKTNNPYHNLLTVLGILHKLHYFIIEGNLTKHLTDLQVMALLLAGITHCFSHPYQFFEITKL